MSPNTTMTAPPDKTNSLGTEVIVGISIGGLVGVAVLLIIVRAIIKHVQRQRRYATYNKAMVERGIERRSQVGTPRGTLNTTAVQQAQPSDAAVITTAFAQQHANIRPMSTMLPGNQTDSPVVSGVWMGEESEDNASNRNTSNAPASANEIIYAQPEKKSIRQSNETKISFRSVEKHTLGSHVNKEPKINESRNVQSEGAKPKDGVVYAMPQKKTSIRKVNSETASQEQEVKGHKVDLNEGQNSKVNPEKVSDDCKVDALPQSKTGDAPRKAIEDGVVYAQPIKKTGSKKVAPGEEDDDYATLRDESSTVEVEEAISTAGYEDDAIDQTLLGVPDNIITNVPLSMALKSMSLPSAEKVKRMLVGEAEAGEQYEAEGPLYAQPIKKVSGVNALHTLTGEEPKRGQHSSLKGRMRSTQSERSDLARSVILDPWAKRHGLEAENGQAKKRSSKKESGYEKVELAETRPPFGVKMPHIPPKAVEKLKNHTKESGPGADNAKRETERQELAHLDDLHHVADDGSIYTIPMKKTPSIKSTTETPSQELQLQKCKEKPSMKGKSGYEDVDLSGIKPSIPSKPGIEPCDDLKANGVESSDPMYASSPVLDKPPSLHKETSSSEKGQSLPRKLPKSGRHISTEEAFVVLGTPGKKNPTLKESGKPPSTVIIPDKPAPDVESKKAIKSSQSLKKKNMTSSENQIEEPAYAISNILPTPQTPISISGDCDQQNKKRVQPPPPKIVQKKSLETTKAPKK